MDRGHETPDLEPALDPVTSLCHFQQKIFAVMLYLLVLCLLSVLATCEETCEEACVKCVEPCSSSWTIPCGTRPVTLATPLCGEFQYRDDPPVLVGKALQFDQCAQNSTDFVNQTGEWLCRECYLLVGHCHVTCASVETCQALARERQARDRLLARERFVGSGAPMGLVLLFFGAVIAVLHAIDRLTD
jgi:hypothetical protein